MAQLCQGGISIFLGTITDNRLDANTDEWIWMNESQREFSVLQSVLERLSPSRTTSDEVSVGIGDDASVFSTDGIDHFVWTIDTLTEEQDFRFDWPNGHRSNGHSVGWKAVAQNLSDINAMGATPFAILVSITIPLTGQDDFAAQVMSGVSAALDALDIPQVLILGGDIGRGGCASCTITALGTLKRESRPLTRSKACAGDQVIVTGAPGFAAAGLAILQSDASIGDTKIIRAAIAAQLNPKPDLNTGELLRDLHATAAIDVSDGILSECLHLAMASSVGVDLDSSAVAALGEPLRHIAQSTGSSAISWVLSGGEDYVLLATLPASTDLPPFATRLGQVTGLNSVVTIDGERLEPDSLRGWDPWRL